jgi:hypothetical protein
VIHSVLSQAKHPFSGSIRLSPQMAPSYTPGQRTSISQFVSFTQSKESIAAKVRITPIQSVPVPRALPLHCHSAPPLESVRSASGEARATADFTH